MICRASRDRLAWALRSYVAGRITNDDLDAVDVDVRDRGVAAVQEMAWANLYCDLRKHYVEGRVPRGSEQRRAVARWIVFLHTDLEYPWPTYAFIQIESLLLDVLTLGAWSRRWRRRWAAFRDAGDLEVWPFLTREGLEADVRTFAWKRDDAQGRLSSV